MLRTPCYWRQAMLKGLEQLLMVSSDLLSAVCVHVYEPFN